MYETICGDWLEVERRAGSVKLVFGLSFHRQMLDGVSAETGLEHCVDVEDFEKS